MYPLRALFFAFEDRDQIVKLILETFERLAAATSGNKSSKELWENIYAYMTDAASKNLKLGYEVSKQLGTKHVPIHLLCKSHTCEKLDESCINVLVKIEQQLKVAEMITNRQPNLRSFIRQSKSVVLCALTALLKLVSHEESAKPTPLAKNFDIMLEEDDVTKSFSLYKERRFTKLGYTAGSIIDCIPQFEKRLSETTYNNSLVQACRLYLENDYILAALKALSYFTYKVTMSYLNCVEKCNQNDLTDIQGKIRISRQSEFAMTSCFHLRNQTLKYQEKQSL